MAIEDSKTLASGSVGEITSPLSTDNVGVWRGSAGSQTFGWTALSNLFKSFFGSAVGYFLATEADDASGKTFAATDSGNETRATAGVTFGLPTGLSKGWRHVVWNDSGSTVTIDGAASTTVNGVSAGNVSLLDDEVATIACHGSNVYSVVKGAFATAA